MTRRTLEGAFLGRDLSHGLWSLTCNDRPAVQLYVKVCGEDVGASMRTADSVRLDLEWQKDGVTVTVTAKKIVRVLNARMAIIHEPRPHLYDALPLASFDPQARRFWQRVFVLMRIPGGRLLLRWIARRRR